MLHIFKMHGDHIAYDSETQTLLMVDEVGHQLLDLYNQQDQAGQYPPQISTETLRRLSEETTADYPDVVETAEAIDGLIAQELLFARPVEVDLELLYPDRPRIKAMCLHLSHDCNLRCEYCFAGQGEYGGDRTMLDSETGKRAIDFLIEASGPRHNLDIDFFGGEPLMNWPVVVELTHYAERRAQEVGKDIRLTITTNALLLNEEKTAFINEHFKNVVLSIDGRPETHNRMRPAQNQKPSFSPVMRNIKNFVEQRGDKEFYVRGTYTHNNLDFADDVIFMAEQDLKQISIEPVVAPDSEQYALKETDLPQLLNEYERLALHYDEKRDGEHPYRFFHFNMDLTGGPCDLKRMKGCGVGSEYIAVTPAGEIYPCHQFVGQDEFVMGSVYDEPSMLNPELTNVFEDMIVPSRPACDSCWAKHHCSGGCAANNYHASGDLKGLYEMGCELQKKRLECGLWLQAREQLRESMSETN